MNGLRPPLVCDVDDSDDSTTISKRRRNPDRAVTYRILKEIRIHSQQQYQRQSKNDEQQQRILCVMMTHSGVHHTKVKAVLETWGQQCDGWFIASNETDQHVRSTKVKTPAEYNLLWMKLNETLRHVASKYINAYDWFYKVDDDTFVIMENLHEFLRIQKQKITSSEENRIQPQIFGYLLQDQTWRDQRRYFDLSIPNRRFGDYFLSHIRTEESSHVEYLAGGSGYIMNRPYLRRLVWAMESNLTLYGEVPEDMAHGMTILAQNISPCNSKDALGREYFIPEEPALWDLRCQSRGGGGGRGRRTQQNQQSMEITSRHKRGGSFAQYPIAFHHTSVSLMRDMYDRLYLCRKDTIDL